MLWDGNFPSVEALQTYFELLAPLYSYQSKSPQPIDWTDRILSVEAVNEAFAGFLRSYDLRPELKNITAPSLILAGRHDWICAPEFSEEIAALIPRSDLRIFENSGHAIRSDEPQKLLDAIAGFLMYQPI